MIPVEKCCLSHTFEQSLYVFHGASHLGGDGGIERVELVGLLCALVREVVALSAAVVLLARGQVKNATAAVVGPSRRQGTGEPPPDTTEIARCGLQSDPVVEILRLATAAPCDRVAEPNPRLGHVTSVYLVAE